MQLTKPVDLPQLESELAAAGVNVKGLWTHGTPANEIGTYDPDGAEIDLPASAGPVLAAHVAQDPVAEAAAARRASIATVLNNSSVLSAGHEAERDAWCDLLGAVRLSLLTPPIPSTQAVTAADIVLRG